MAKAHIGSGRLPRLLRGLPPRHFGAMLVDPPWFFRSYAASINPKSDRHVERHYDTMTLDDIKALPIRDFAAPTGCHLFLCATGPCLKQALDTMEDWGFTYSGMAFVWAKLKKSHPYGERRIHLDFDFHVGLGFTTRKNVEFVLLGRRGNARRNSKKVRELIVEPRREHSQKPEEIRRRIEEYCDGPYLELFARSQRRGWTARGDEVGKHRATQT